MTKYKRKLYVHITSCNIIYVSKFYMDSNMPSTPKDVKLKLLNDHLHIFSRDIGTYPGSCWNRDTVSQGLYDPPDSVIAKVHEDANQVERHQGILQIVPCLSGNSWASYRILQALVEQSPHIPGISSKKWFQESCPYFGSHMDVRKQGIPKLNCSHC